MSAFVVAVPMFSYDLSVRAYRMISKQAKQIFEPTDDFREFSRALDTTSLDVIYEIGQEPFAGDSYLFTDLNEYHVLMGVPNDTAVNPEKLVCVLKEGISIDEVVLKKLKSLRDRGFKLAYFGKPVGPYEKFVSTLDYIVLDYNAYSFKELMATISKCHRKTVVAIIDIPKMSDFRKIGKLSNVLYSGSFYSESVVKSRGDIPPLKVNALSLMNQINQEDFDLAAAAGIIEKDPSLSVSLLRFLNYQNKSSSGRKIDSIRNAVAIMGQKEVKRWATVAISLQLAEDRPSEITRLSLIRAKFAENLATSFEMGIMAPSLFMAGLFSMLDLMLEKPMPLAIKEIAVDERVRAALVDETGDFYKVLELIYAYERAEWYNVSICMMRDNVQADSISKAFIDALVWYSDLLKSIDDKPATEGDLHVGLPK